MRIYNFYKNKTYLLLFTLNIFCITRSFGQSFSSSNLPIFIVNTNGKTIYDEPKINANLKVVYNTNGTRNFVNATTFHYNGTIGIELRGSSSLSLSPKSPYSIELRDSLGEDISFPLLGLPKESDFALLAPYSDKSLIREVLTYQLASEIMAWAPKSIFVELIVNGEYKGVYVLTEKIKRDKNRVNISEQDVSPVSGDELTGGYILSIDKFSGGQTYSWQSKYPFDTGLKGNTNFQVVYPKLEDLNTEQKNYIKKFVDYLDAIFQGTYYKDSVYGYQKYIDIPSFVDFIIMNEITKNVDGYRISTYFYKDKNSINPKLKAGPVWDFNIALGNAEYCDGNITYGWGFDFNKICSEDDFLIHFWWSKLLQDESFKKKLIERYKSLRKTTLTNARVLSKIDSMSNWLQESQARNFTKWKILNQYVWPNAYVGGNYTNEINYLKSYLTNRMTWMDGNIDKLLTSNSEVPTNTTLPEVFPNPFDADIQFKMNIEPNTINELLVYDAMGSLFQKNQLNQSNSFTLDTQQWKEGFYYFVLLKDGNVIHSFASVKVKNR